MRCRTPADNTSNLQPSQDFRQTMTDSVIFALMPDFIRARIAAYTLRDWVAEHYAVPALQLDRAMTLTLVQLDHVASRKTYYGYDVSRAPSSLLEPISGYMEALHQKHGPREQSDGFPKVLVRTHQQVIHEFETLNRLGNKAR
ncbi:hypothetical protein JK196_10745 [Gluconobacter albidus]|nr:hypothetical protein [Gluconobacter albidus]MBS1031744.1 hypothetical protein [Gluconobacter cerinus]MBS1044312.1 hypothetical protein [Gluconobacter cerinus]MBS1053534.1 hypothetical protein [Gluconobacter kondonii]MBS1056915.1 hypothetical protein [Gluconobacter kondonii]